MKPMHVFLIVAGLAVVACGKKADDQSTKASEKPAESTGMGEHQGMRMGSNMPMMQAHMDSMMRMAPGQMSQMIATHERMMSQMMDQMGSEMRQMKMSENREWSALTDSVKQDLAELPSLKGQTLSARMRAHADRVRRLIAAHEQMMKGMH
jgi:hypothetical protein